MKEVINFIAPQIATSIINDKHLRREYSEFASDFLYDTCTQDYTQMTSSYLRLIRWHSLDDKHDSEFLSELQNRVDILLTASGMKKSNFGYWHSEGDNWHAVLERNLKERFQGRIMSCGQESGSWITGERFLENWLEMADFPSSPLEALELWLADPEVDYFGAHESEWGYFYDWLREELEQKDLTEMEDLDDALSDLDCGIFLEDIPLDYRKAALRMFDELKAEQHEPECEYEEEYE